MILASLNIPAAFPLCRHESHNQRLFTQTKQVAEMLLRKHTLIISTCGPQKQLIHPFIFLPNLIQILPQRTQSNPPNG